MYLLIFLLGISFTALADIGVPLTNDADTIGLYKFDSDTTASVIDSSSSPVTGVAMDSSIEAIPSIDSSYGLGRKFSASSSYISLGVVRGTKFDLSGEMTISIEAIIHLTANANATHVIFDNDEVQFLIVDNKLAGFVRQESGFVGFVGEKTLSLNTSYRAALVFSGGRLGLFVDGKNVGGFKVKESIAQTPSDEVAVYIGGNPDGAYFPGFIDDMRISRRERRDNAPPKVTLLSLQDGAIVTEKRPNLNIAFSDESRAIDVSSAKVYVNDTLQTGLTVSSTGITGKIEQDLSRIFPNEIKVEVSDNAGNLSQTISSVSRRLLVRQTEYEVDEDTLLLYHMNEFAPWDMADESVLNRDALWVPQNEYVRVSEGVFGNGKYFRGTSRGMVAPKVNIPGEAFTFEVWLRPEADPSSSTILSTQQLKIERVTSGFIKVTLITKERANSFQTKKASFLSGELHHLAVTWDGTKENDNLTVYRDGVGIETFDAPYDCDFAKNAGSVLMGYSYTGLMDELRLSSVIREGFNVIPNFQGAGIIFNNLKHRGSTLEERPTLDIEFNLFEGVKTGDVSIYLNDVDQTSSDQLTVTTRGVSGKMKNALLPGLNKIKIELKNLNDTKRSKTIFVYHIENLGGRRNVEAAKENAALILDFDGILGDKSAKAMDIVSFDNGAPGLIGNSLSRALNTNPTVIPVKSRSFTIEMMLKSDTSSFGGHFFSLFRGSRYYYSSRYYPNYCEGICVELNAQGDLIVRLDRRTGSHVSPPIERAVPNDGKYHHFAMIYDYDRDFSNLLILVDGKVVYEVDYDCGCDISERKLYIGASSNKFVDE
ncbi:MAG: hypothetical protein OXB88_08185, partial [Bacteriovoracales bacterium]|nr:hypothetical protein [Bacteriovoracales bacterium]